MWDFSDARDLLNQSFNVARGMVREIFTGEIGDPVDPLPPRHDAGDAEPAERIQLDKTPSLMTQMARSSPSSNMPRVRVKSLTQSHHKRKPPERETLQ
jgi:hypothetical protein